MNNILTLIEAGGAIIDIVIIYIGKRMADTAIIRHGLADVMPSVSEQAALSKGYALIAIGTIMFACCTISVMCRLIRKSKESRQ